MMAYDDIAVVVLLVRGWRGILPSHLPSHIITATMDNTQTESWQSARSARSSESGIIFDLAPDATADRFPPSGDLGTEVTEQDPSLPWPHSWKADYGSMDYKAAAVVEENNKKQSSALQQPR